ncbi:LLM class flavin-dependent oxidoreductase [Streptomyces abyssomicinicus]|uniref:LLM class flavin-dependent oxidoreductase n=1 Tax=Streptomyces abyssomicinicus TaxID=574929 RepID=UPI001FE7874A|nr:LLM class flavin-dependent oxidoreductase [Streptomyces abyssomicinicus]
MTDHRTRTTPPSRLRLALEADGAGAHPAAWRRSGRPPAALTAPGTLREVVAAAQDAGFDLVTLADAPRPPASGPETVGRLEAGTRAAYVSRLTDRIGLAPTLQVTTTEPFHLATQLASLDHASHGRAGWVVGATADEGDLATVGRNPLPSPALLREAADVIDAARALWDTWEDDAVIRDAATGRFLDRRKVHHIDFEGPSFTVKGPLITPRPPQGQLVVLAPQELDVAARADVVLVGGHDVDAVAARAGAVRAAAVEAAATAAASGGGSSPTDGPPLVFAELEVVLDAEAGASRFPLPPGSPSWTGGPPGRTPAGCGTSAPRAPWCRC